MDADNRQQRVEPQVLREVLGCLGLEADTDQQIEASLKVIAHQNNHGGVPPLLTCDQNAVLELAAYFPPSSRYELVAEQGDVLHGTLDDRTAACRTPGLSPPEDRRDRTDRGGRAALVPHGCAARRPERLGLTAQPYSLRRPGDGGLGDTQALEALVRNAGAHGADALGISPVHAMFGAHINQYSPYSPSSRLFYNVLHAAPGSILGEWPVRQAIEACGLGELERLERLDLIDWPAVAQSRQRLLRQLFDDFSRARTRNRPISTVFAPMAAKRWRTIVVSRRCTTICVTPKAIRSIGATGRRTTATRPARRWNVSPANMPTRSAITPSASG